MPRPPGKGPELPVTMAMQENQPPMFSCTNARQTLTYHEITFKVVIILLLCAVTTYVILSSTCMSVITQLL